MELKCGELDLRLEPLTSPDKEGWMPCQVTVAVPGFQGRFQTEMQPDDLERFKETLTYMDTHIDTPCESVLAGLEQGIHMVLRNDRRGGISGEYQFETHTHGDTPTRLTGAFMIDQTYLKPLIQGLTDDLARTVD